MDRWPSTLEFQDAVSSASVINSFFSLSVCHVRGQTCQDFPTVPQRQKASLPPITSAQPARKVPRWGHTDRSSRSLTTPYAPKGAVPGRRCVTRWFCVATQSPRGGQLGVTPVILQNSPIWSRGSRLLFFLRLHLARPYFGPTV